MQQAFWKIRWSADCITTSYSNINSNPKPNTLTLRLTHNLTLTPTPNPTWYKDLYHYTKYVIGIYLTVSKFTFEIKESSMSHSKMYHRTLVKKEGRDVARDLRYRTILSGRHINGMYL